MNQPRMLNLSQKWIHLRQKLGVNGDGIIEDGASKWLVDLEERAKVLLGKTRIDQTKKWIINAEGPTAAIPDFVCKAHSLELFGSSETTVGGTSKIKHQRRVI